MTHRFINADGLVSTGTGILGHNMFAYCDNNPINNLDYDGAKTVNTISGFQKSLVYSKNLNYNIMDITKLQQQGYSNNDKVILKDDGMFTDYSTGYKIWDSFVAVLSSVNMDFGVGFGVGGGLGVDNIVELQGVIKYEPFSMHADIDGFKFGQKTSAEATASLGVWDLASIGGEDFYPYTTNELESSIETNGIGISFGCYAIIGFDLSFYWDVDYISSQWNAIW